MAACDVCGQEENMPYHCRHCGGTYCSDHRLPESHDCPVVDQWDSEGAVFESTFDDSLGGTGTTSSESWADRLGLDTGPGGPLAYVRGNMTYIFLGAMWVTFALQLGVLAFSENLHDTIFVFSSEQPLYAWTWVTSIFAHGSFIHIVFNSIVVYFFGRLVEQYIGWKNFALVFLASGILAGFGQVGYEILEGGTVGVVGASGAALALMGILTVLNRNLTVYLYFIIPMPIWVITGGTVVISAFLIVGGSPGAGGVAHVAHLVGVLVGLAYGYHVKDRVRLPGRVQFGGGPGGGMGGPGGPGGPGRGPF